MQSNLVGEEKPYGEWIKVGGRWHPMERDRYSRSPPRPSEKATKTTRATPQQAKATPLTSLSKFIPGKNLNNVRGPQNTEVEETNDTLSTFITPISVLDMVSTMHENLPTLKDIIPIEASKEWDDGCI